MWINGSPHCIVFINNFFPPQLTNSSRADAHTKKNKLQFISIGKNASHREFRVVHYNNYSTTVDKEEQQTCQAAEKTEAFRPCSAQKTSSNCTYARRPAHSRYRSVQLHPLLEKHYIILFSHHIAFLYCCHTTRYTFHYTCHHFYYYYLLSTHTVHLHLFIYYIHTPKFIYLHTFTIYIVLIFIYSMVKDHNTVYWTAMFQCWPSTLTAKVSCGQTFASRDPH